MSLFLIVMVLFIVLLYCILFYELELFITNMLFFRNLSKKLKLSS